MGNVGVGGFPLWTVALAPTQKFYRVDLPNEQTDIGSRIFFSNGCACHVYVRAQKQCVLVVHSGSVPSLLCKMSPAQTLMTRAYKCDLARFVSDGVKAGRDAIRGHQASLRSSRAPPDLLDFLNGHREKPDA